MKTDEFVAKIKEHSNYVRKHMEYVESEAATKQSFVLPMLQILGYDIRNPQEVRPEFFADVGDRKGERVDYAIFIDDFVDENVKMIIECKHWKEDLNIHKTQLERYFNHGKVPGKIALLTNGLVYNFFTDIEKENILDSSPFLSLDLSKEPKESAIQELYRFHRDQFNENEIKDKANTLQYTTIITQKLQHLLDSPTEDFIKFISKDVYKGKKFTENVNQVFKEIVVKSIKEVISDMVTERLQKAIKVEAQKAEENVEVKMAVIAEENNNKIETTDEEILSYHIIRAILATEVPDLSRVTYKDGVHYFSINIDGSKKKLICRLGLNENNKWMEINIKSDENSLEKIQLDSINDIYKYKDRIIECASKYLN